MSRRERKSKSQPQPQSQSQSKSDADVETQAKRYQRLLFIRLCDACGTGDLRELEPNKEKKKNLI